MEGDGIEVLFNAVPQLHAVLGLATSSSRSSNFLKHLLVWNPQPATITVQMTSGFSMDTNG